MPPKRPRRRWGLLALLILLLGGGLFVLGKLTLNGPKEATSPAAPVAPTAPTTASQTAETGTVAPGTDSTQLENALGLALQGISLFSGEKGAELWRLKASWAHLSRENNEILVDLPVVRYTLGDPPATALAGQEQAPNTPEDYLDVKSEKGKITDNQRYLTLWGNVDVRRDEDMVTGPRLEYDSKTRIMVFPDGAELESPKASGEAARLTWNLGSNELTGEGGVVVVIKPQPEAEADEASVQEPEPVPVQTPTKITKPAQAPKPAQKASRKPTRAAETSGR